MKSFYNGFILLFIVSAPINTSAAYRMLFLGLHGDGAPAIEATFDKSLRERLSVVPNLTLIDYLETQRYRHSTDFERNPTISEKRLKKLLLYLSDSVLVIWGRIHALEIKPVRSNLLNAALQGNLTVGITVYHLSRGTFLHSGTIKSSYTLPKGISLFSPVKKTVSISASDRAAITDNLMDDVCAETTDIIAAILRSVDLLKPELLPGSAENNSTRPPSISDVFSVPSVNAKEINRRKQSENTVVDTTNP